MQHQELIPHLFRTEHSKIVAVLCAKFGFNQIEIAEDLASETFVAALETWPYKGIPENPSAWLFAVAKNKAKNHFARTVNLETKILPEYKNLIETDTITQDPILTSDQIVDAQLQMMFAVCHPSLSEESQICLALRILCGFGIDEISNALLSNKDTITKRLYRAKEKLKDNRIELEFPSEEVCQSRLDGVLTTLYLLYNEGYYSESNEAILRADLCFEAIRLTFLLIQNPATNVPKTNALLALMYFHSSRFNARKNMGEMVLYADQDSSLWDQNLISKGAYHLHQAAVGNELTSFHLEAMIAYWYTVPNENGEKWQRILDLYDQLLHLKNVPVVALNRLFAYSKVKGNLTAIKEAEKLDFRGNRYYHALLGELYLSVNLDLAKAHFENALFYAKTRAEKESIRRKITALAINRSQDFVG
ncbi:MAG TPA: sigma-70 family RNA polymerase sigma factor [Saprospiraceae bacterium]|nr:sigma-70 family RNA polymerase sigma factor [Saprospiraceae bacterium]